MQENRWITLYSAQAEPVLKTLAHDGICYSKADYVRRKYGESAPIFLTAYGWFVREMEHFVERPVKAEYPYWAFADELRADLSGGGKRLRLVLPRKEAVFFDARDWVKILKLSYIGETAEEERAFSEELSACGLNTNRIMLTSFYPEWRERIFNSWKRLFRYHEAIRAGQIPDGIAVQAGLWQIKKEWIS